MANLQPRSNVEWAFPTFGSKVLILVLAANMLVLHAEHDQERGKGKQASPARQAPAVARQPGRGPGGMDAHAGQREFRTPNGATVRTAPGGGRQVTFAHPDGRVVVANGGGHFGYVQRPFMSHGQAYNQRTYMRNGVSYAHIYRPWSYGGRQYNIYTPNYYYRPAFYTWAYTPWARPVRYGWGWNGSPWYGYYGGYFTPYPTYVSPCFWLADYVIATTLESAYLAQNQPSGMAPTAYDGANGMTPEVKQAIADEVRRQMDQEQADQAAAQANGQVTAPPPIFSDRGPRIFLVSNDLTAYSRNGEVPLIQGDVIRLVRTPNPNAEMADVQLLASHGSLCPRGTLLTIRTVDLQELQNHMQATIDQGLEKLQADQGKNGIPEAPPQAMGAVNSSYSSDIHPDSNAQSDLAQALKDANFSDPTQPVPVAEAPAATGTGGSINLGMTFSQVVNALGQPRNTVDLGIKKIYVYKDLKVIFMNGRVSDVQ